MDTSVISRLSPSRDAFFRSTWQSIRCEQSVAPFRFQTKGQKAGTLWGAVFPLRVWAQKVNVRTQFPFPSGASLDRKEKG